MQDKQSKIKSEAEKELRQYEKQAIQKEEKLKNELTSVWKKVEAAKDKESGMRKEKADLEVKAALEAKLRQDIED